MKIQVSSDLLDGLVLAEYDEKWKSPDSIRDNPI